MAKTYRVAVIAGDGIGREVVPEGISARLEAGGAALRLRARLARVRLELRDLREDRTDDAGGRHRQLRSFDAVFPRRGRLSPACRTMSRCGDC